MGIFGRRRRGGLARSGGLTGRRNGGLSAEDRAHLTGFVTSRRGVEAYVEPATNVTPWTVVLVAHDGEWTRRPVTDPADARAFANQAGIPVYDIAATGYPPRMRAWSSARKRTSTSERPSPQPGRPADEEMPPDPFG